MSRRWGVPRGSRLPGCGLALLCQAVLEALKGHVALKSLVLYDCWQWKVGVFDGIQHPSSTAANSF